MHDVSAQLPRHTTARYDTRTLDTIKRVVVHHTVTRDNVTPERIAQVQVSQGRAGITYHFLIGGDGAIYQTNALETVSEQTVTPAAQPGGARVLFTPDAAAWSSRVDLGGGRVTKNKNQQ